MTGPQVKSSKPPKLPTQVTNKDEKTFEKEEHQAIYRAFLDTLENPENLEKQTKQEIEKKRQKLKEELLDQEKQKLQSDLKSLDERLERLQNGNEKKIFTFISKNHKGIFNNINQEDIKLLSEENFLQFLLSVSQKIREKNLASEENLKNDKIKQEVAECVADIRGTEAKDSLIKLPGWLFGIKVDPKNISSSFMNGVKEKIPFLGKDKKEEDEPPLSDEEMVTTFLSKSLFPIIALTTVILLGSLSGPVSVLGLFTIPHVIVIGFAVFGLAVAEYKAVKGLFSNDKKGTLYNPHSRDEKERKEWGNEISDGINKILEISVEKAKGSEQPTSVSEQISQGKEKSEQQPVPEQISQGKEKSEQQPNSMFEKISVGPLAKNTEQQR
ncbi:hypothetical protein [Wolbachia endosymbiont (group A) of Pogonocherus hispidulus]|uniref:hypothetical protein n=1 Tax=Wolbachia endosymbiont (group A) of Pogonocherus hispidulus TaxID=3066136 RepID=UPI00333FACB5